MGEVQFISVILQLAAFVIPLIVCGLIIGRTVERQHFRRLEQFETQHRDFLVTQLKSFPMAGSQRNPPSLVVAEVVIASDYLKSWLAQWRNLFGG